MRNLLSSISFKIILGYAAVLIITLIAALTLNSISGDVKQHVATFTNDTLPELADLEKISSNISEMEVMAYSLYGTTINVKKFDQQVEKLSSDSEKLIEGLSKKFSNNSDNKRFDQFHVNLIELRNTMDNSTVDWDQARTKLAELSQQATVVKSVLNSNKSKVATAAAQSSNTINADLANAYLMNWLLVTVIFTVAIVAYLYSRSQVASPVLSLSEQLKVISENLDLTTTLPARSNDEIGSAANGINHLLSVFHRGISDVVETIQGISSSVSSMEKVTSQSENSVRLLNCQIDTLVVQMTQLEEKIEESSNTSTAASETAARGADEVEMGSREVEKTSASILALSDDMESTARMLLALRFSGDRVSTVVSTIAEIADQTNLLALNAAIEAARAGESGRGFAVVADEVRTLATRTHQSTVEINSMLESIVSSITMAVDNMSSNQEKAKQSVKLSQNTVNSLSTIRETILGLSNECIDVASVIQKTRQEVVSAREQVNHFKSLGYTVAESNQATLNTSHSLTSLAKRLGSLSAQFKI